MDKETVTLIAALIAASASVVTVLLNRWNATSIERMKWVQARDDEAKRNLGITVAEFAREIATGAQRAVWLLWIAENRPGSFSVTDLDSYDADMKAVFPKMFGALVMVAAYDKVAYEKLEYLANRLYEIDADVSMAGTKFRDSSLEGLEALRKQLKPALSFFNELSRHFAKVFDVSAPLAIR